MRVHPVFHVSLLEPSSSDPLPGQVQPPSPPTIIEEEEFWDFQEILDSRRHRNRIEYLVQLLGYDYPTLETIEVFDSPDPDSESLQRIRDFHSKYPGKPRPRRLP